MTDKKKDDFLEKNLKDLDEICEECHKEDESVTQNLIMTGYKLCKSCRTSKTVFPLQLILLTGIEFILFIMNVIERKAIIRKDKNTIPKDFKLDFKFNICFVDIIKEANIQNCVRKIIGKTKSGVTAKNLIKPGA